VLIVLRSVKEMQEYVAAAVDGEIGEVEEFYLDDRYWTIRYLVVGMSNDETYQRVLITPAALGQPDRAEQVLRVALSMEQARNRPDVDSDRPISRQGRSESGSPEEEPNEPGDPHLRSTKEVIGYHIRARDGEIGHVEDFVVNDETWTIHFVVVDTRNWWPGRKVLMAPTWIKQVDWAEGKVEVDLSKGTIEKSPQYDPSLPLDAQYEKELYDYYDRPYYWH
jgi:sporulation protein YlmC with PRC-barrel domain